MESLLSVDNALALAAKVKHLPEKLQKKALRYGMFGAFFFRGLCLLFASYAIQHKEFKFAGAIYLIWLSISHFRQKREEEVGKKASKKTPGFFMTVVAVELLDLALSIDNIFASVAISDQKWIVVTGVCIGIIAMRFVAGWFCKLLERFPALETSAYVIILLLGIKLLLSFMIDMGNHYYPGALVSNTEMILKSEYFEYGFSILTMLIFVLPLLSKRNSPIKSVAP